MNLRWLLRMSRWARHPPSQKRVVLFLVVLGVCLLLFGFERLFGWPDWLTLQNMPRGRVIR